MTPGWLMALLMFGAIGVWIPFLVRALYAPDDPPVPTGEPEA